MSFSVFDVVEPGQSVIFEVLFENGKRLLGALEYCHISRRLRYLKVLPSKFQHYLVTSCKNFSPLEAFPQSPSTPSSHQNALSNEHKNTPMNHSRYHRVYRMQFVPNCGLLPRSFMARIPRVCPVHLQNSPIPNRSQTPYLPHQQASESQVLTARTSGPTQTPREWPTWCRSTRSCQLAQRQLPRSQPPHGANTKPPTLTATMHLVSLWCTLLCSSFLLATPGSTSRT